MAFRNYHEQQHACVMRPRATFQDSFNGGNRRQVAKDYQSSHNIGRHQQFADFEELAFRMSKPSDSNSCGDSDAPTAVPLGDETSSDNESSSLSNGGNSVPCLSPCATPKERPASSFEAHSSPFYNRSLAEYRNNVCSTHHIELGGSSPEDFAAAFKAASTSWNSRGTRASQKVTDTDVRPHGRREKGHLKGSLRYREQPALNFGYDHVPGVDSPLSPCYVRTWAEGNSACGKQTSFCESKPCGAFDFHIPLKVLLPAYECGAPYLNPTMPVKVILPESL